MLLKYRSLPFQDEAQAARKIPIEKLTKEELVKKYRQAILIAQKAKETKVGKSSVLLK